MKDQVETDSLQSLQFKGVQIIAKNQNTYAKRQREANKKAKAQAKLTRRLQRKQASENVVEHESETVDPQAADGQIDDPS